MMWHGARRGDDVVGRTFVRRFGHVPELDCVRGAALIMVVLSHLWIVWPTWRFHRVFADGGFIGVDVFFVLSGFLITTLLLQEQARTGTVRIGPFLWRRALRLFPALWLLLAAHALYAWVAGWPPVGRADFEWDSIQAAGLYYMNWHALWDPISAGDLSPMWSLSIEGQFYALWPFVVLLGIGIERGRRTTLGLLVGAVVAVTLWRYVLFDREGWAAAYLRSDSHIDGLLVGALAGCAWVRGWTPSRLPRWLVPAGALVIAAAFPRIKADQVFTYAGGTSLVIAATAVIVLTMTTERRTELGAVGRALALVGRLSYGIYLWHFPVLWAATRWGADWSSLQRTASAVAVTAAGVLTSRVLVELPALTLKPRRPGAQPVSEPAASG